MKKILTIFLACCSFTAFAGSKTFDKLAEVNKCWLEQTDVSVTALPGYKNLSEKEWIRTHLTLVEKTLRARSTAHLSASQKQNRLKCLDDLNQYWHEGNFPVNDRYSYRTPIFIDQYDNFCAVGYLVKASGNESVSRMISAQTNLAYVKDMRYKELFSWADENGFTVDELAWIQPAYPPVRKAAPVGGGTDGEVHELYADNPNGKLYVGGSFMMVDSTITANNIAYVTEAGGVYTWHNMGTGVNGPVYAIVEYDDKIYVAGSFTEAGGVPVNNIAYWDGGNWHDAGCISGTVNDLAVYNNELYAAGQFDVCASFADVNFAHWNGTVWQSHPGLIGTVNTMEVIGNELFLGGNFTNGTAMNVVKWDGSGFQSFANNIENEVKDFAKYQDTFYAICKRTAAMDSSLFNKLDNNAWLSDATYLTYNPFSGTLDFSFNTLCSHGDTLMMGGNFRQIPVVGTMASNCVSVYHPGGPSNWFSVDSAINVMTVFKSELIAGGKFMYGHVGFGWGVNKLNGIARKAYGISTSAGTIEADNATITIYPNPANSASVIVIDNKINGESLLLKDVTGKTLARYKLRSQQNKIELPALTAGTYIMEVADSKGATASQKIVIK